MLRTEVECQAQYQQATVRLAGPLQITDAQSRNQQPKRLVLNCLLLNRRVLDIIHRCKLLRKEESLAGICTLHLAKKAAELPGTRGVTKSP